MKKAKYAIIAFVCVCAICAGFYFLSASQTSNEENLTDIDKVLVKDLEKDYPKTPREVIKFYNRIMKGYYGGEATDKQIEGLVDQMMYLLDEDLLLINSRDEYYQSVVADIKSYEEQKKVLVNTDIADSKEVKYLNDNKEGTTETDKLAYIDASYFVREDKQFTNSYQQFVLRQDENGCWKIIAFYEVEGESFDDN